MNMMRIFASYGCPDYLENSGPEMCRRRLLTQIFCVLLLLLPAAASAQDDGLESLDGLEDLTTEAQQEDAVAEPELVVEEEATEEAAEEAEPQEDAADEGAVDASEEVSQEAAASAPGPVNRREISAEYVLRLQELEDRVNDLKEQIFRSKSRLVLLRERILGTRIGGSQARIMHVNDMSNTFDLERVIYSLDGNQLYAATSEDDELNEREEIELYNGQIVPGPHNVSVEMVFVGNGFGLFSYLEGYRFRLRSSYAFTAEDGKVANLRVVGYEQGGVNQPIEERPDIRYELEFLDVVVTEEE